MKKETKIKEKEIYDPKKGFIINLTRTKTVYKFDMQDYEKRMKFCEKCNIEYDDEIFKDNNNCVQCKQPLLEFNSLVALKKYKKEKEIL